MGQTLYWHLAHSVASFNIHCCVMWKRIPFPHWQWRKETFREVK